MVRLRATFGRGMALKVGGMILHFGVAATLSRWYGAALYGEYAYFFSWVVVLALLSSLGLDWLLVRETAYLKTQGPAQWIPGLVRWAHWLSGAVAVVVAVALIVVAQRGEALNVVLLFVALALPFFAWLRIRQGALQGLDFPVASQLPINVFLPTLFLLGIIVSKVWHWRLTTAALLSVYLACLVVVFLATGQWLRGVLSKYPSVKIPFRKEWLYSALRLLASSGLGLLIYQIPVLLSGSWLGPATAGVADVLVRGSLVIAFPLGAVNLPLAPFVAGSADVRVSSDVQATIQRSTRLAFVGAFFLSLGYIVAAFYFLPALLGAVYRVPVVWLCILALGQLINVGVGPVVLILNMRSHEIETLKGMLLGLAVIGGGGWVFRSWHLGGILAAYTFGLSAWNIYLLFRVRSLFGLDPSIFSVLDFGAKN